MRGFMRIPSVVQIWLAQMIVLLFLSDPVIRLVDVIARPATGILKTKFDWFDLVPWAIGALCLVWLMLTIFRPSLGRVKWTPFFQAGPLPVWNHSAALTYTFPSTHPAYVFMDALAAGFAYFIYWAWADAWRERKLEGIIILALGLATPVARLVGWYVLGLRPSAPAPGPEAARHAEDMLREGWRPVFAFYAVLVPIVVVAGGLGWFYAERDQAARIASAIRIDPAELASRPRYFVEIRDMKASLEQSKLARIRVVVDAAGADRCEHATVKSAVHYNLQTVFGSAGHLMIVIKPEDLPKLKSRLAPEGTVDLLGILVRPPRPGAIPAWRQHVYCALNRLAQQPRWIFEVEDVLANRR